jgi:8-oxo-dGTP diphosphatase
MKNYNPKLKSGLNEEKNQPRAGCGVMVVRNNKVLLGRRHSDPKKADSQLHGEGTWTMPGGKLHFGETFEESGKRELLEETGIKGKNFKVISVTNDIVSDAHFVTIGLLCQEFVGEPRVMEPDEITVWKWFSFGKLPERIFPPSFKMIKNYKNKVFYGF